MATGATRELPEAEAPALMEEACDILVPAGMHAASYMHTQPSSRLHTVTHACVPAATARAIHRNRNRCVSCLVSVMQ